MMNVTQSEGTGHSELCYESVNKSCLKVIYPALIRVPLYMICLTIIVLTVGGNLLVIISIAHFKQLHTPTNYLILSLAMADLLLGSFIMPPSMVRTLETCWYFGDLFCKVHSSTDVMLCNVSILNLSFISIDRYYAVCQPLHYQTKITTSTAVLMILISWNLSFIIGFGMIFLNLNILGIENFYYGNVACVGGCFIFLGKVSATVASVLSFYIPCLIMVIIYQKVFHIAVKQARAVQSIACNKMRSENNTSSKNTERKATKTLAIVMGVFMSCWTPFFTCSIIDPAINYSIPPVLFDTFVWIGYLNSMCNPIVYAFFYKWFRKAFKIIIFGKIFQAHSSKKKLSTD